jgi:hypothetical protein
MYRVTYYPEGDNYEHENLFTTVDEALAFINEEAEDWCEYALWVQLELETVIRVKEDA